MGLREDEVQGVPVVVATGEVDLTSAPRLREALVRNAIERGPSVVVDLSEVAFLDSTGLGVLVGAVKRCRTLGGELHLVVTRPRILAVFEITGLTSILSLHPDVGAAAEAAGARHEAGTGAS